jgi:hypothetical protein
MSFIVENSFPFLEWGIGKKKKGRRIALQGQLAFNHFILPLWRHLLPASSSIFAFLVQLSFSPSLTEHKNTV